MRVPGRLKAELRNLQAGLSLVRVPVAPEGGTTKLKAGLSLVRVPGRLKAELRNLNEPTSIA